MTTLEAASVEEGVVDGAAVVGAAVVGLFPQTPPVDQAVCAQW